MRCPFSRGSTLLPALVACGVGAIALSATDVLAQPAQLPGWDELPDWSGVWGMVGPTVFDRATVQPPDGRAGTPGVREQYPSTSIYARRGIGNGFGDNGPPTEPTDLQEQVQEALRYLEQRGVPVERG